MGRARRSLTSLTRVISHSVTEMVEAGKEVVYYDDSNVSSGDRALGTHLAGRLTRARLSQLVEGNGNLHARNGNGAAVTGLKRAVLNFLEGSVPGNGLGAFNSDGVDIVVHGGVQDGAAKGASGGRIRILKGISHDGVPVDGSVGNASPTARRPACSSCRATPTRARESDFRAPTSSSAGGCARTYATSWATSPRAPTSRASPSST